MRWLRDGLMCYDGVCMLRKRHTRGNHTIVIELIPDEEQGGFTAHIPDIPAYGEGETEEEAISDLKEGLLCFIEARGLQEAISRLNCPSSIRRVEVGLPEFVGMR